MTETLAETTTHSVLIWIAGDASEAERICRRHCMAVGLCVTVTPTTFVYTGGVETGVCVRLVNYPRFPSTPAEINVKAIDLARILRTELYQWSVLVEAPDRSWWLTTREEKSA